MGILDGFLGTSWDDPRTSAILGLAGGLMEGSPMKGLLAMQQANSPEVAMKRELLKAQIDETKTQAEQRALAMQQARDAQAFDQRLFANAFPNGLPGSGAASAGMAAGAPVGGGAAPLSQMSTGALLAQLNEDQMLALVKMGKLPESAIKLWETAKFGKDYKQGDFQQFSDGSQKMIPMVKEGLDFKGGRVGVLPGAAEAQTTLTLANELPKTLLQSAGAVNLRKGDNGKEYPVTSLTENPVLLRLLAGAGLLPPSTSAAPSAPDTSPNASPSAMRITPDEQRARDAESIRILQSEIDAEKNPQTKAGLQRELDRVVQAQSAKGFPAPSMKTAQATQPQDSPPTAGTGYGKTTAQETADAANKSYAEGAAKDMVDVRKNIMAAGMSAPTSIAKYQQLGKLLQDVDGGALTATGTNIASAMNSLGFKIDKNLPNKEAAAALGNEMALELRSPAGGAGMPGAMSDKDREFLVGMIPNASQTTQGRQQLITAQIAIENRKQQVATFARNYEKKYGRLDNGFFEQMQAWSNANPLFGGK